ncbi:MAG: hypothetical protein LC792_19295 [Actinobacteria bacterium]|nr:hypothetical protein [Actinomycetota bacterium]
MIVEVGERFVAPEPVNWETAETGWVAQGSLGWLELHSEFRQTLVRLGLVGDPQL